jgi:hypothetical protein
MDERDKVSLWVKFPVEGWGTIEDLGFRHRLEDALTELLERHQLGTWQGSGQGGGQQDVSYSVPTARLEAAWDLVRAKLTELGVLQRATVEVYRHDDEGPPQQLWPYRNLPQP